MKNFLLHIILLLFIAIPSTYANKPLFKFAPTIFNQAFAKKNAVIENNCLTLNGNSSWNVKLNYQNLEGKTIYVTCNYQTSNINVTKKNQGFKVMFIYTLNGKKTYCHKVPIVGTNNWTTITHRINVPANISDTTLAVSTPCGKVAIKELFVTTKASDKKIAKVANNNFVQKLVSIPNEPTIDGIYSIDEWKSAAKDLVLTSQSTNQKSFRDSFIFYSFDKKNLYICHIGDVPNKPQVLSKKDALVFSLSSKGKNWNFTIYSDGKNNLPKNSKIATNFCGKLFLGSGIPTVAKNVQEISIPWSSLGLKTPPKENELFSLMVKRLWCNPNEIATLDIPCLKFNTLSSANVNISLYSVNARINGFITNKSNKEVTYNLDIMIRSTEVPHQLNKKITVKANSTTPFAQYFMVGGATNRNIDVKISEVNSKKVIYYRNFDWNNSIGVKFFNPNPPIEMNFGLNPSNNRIIAKISSQNAKKFDNVKQIEFQIINSNDVIVQKVLAEKKAKNYYFKDWKYPKLALGKYTIAGIITFQNGKTESFKKSFKIANFPWQNTNVGTNRIIPSPFKELKYKDNEVHALLTGYNANGVFWDKVYAKGENILAGPIKIFYNNKELTTDKEKWVTKDKDLAIRKSFHSAPGLKLEVKHEYEFDGMCKTTLKFMPNKNQKVKDLYIDIPLKDSVAKYFHHTGFGIRSNPSKYIPQGKNVVWSLPYVPLRYPSYIWFGETFKGICFFTDMTPILFDNKSNIPSHQFIRNKNKVTLRIFLATGQESTFIPFEWVCGFQATPVKDRPKGFRNYGGSFWIAKNIPNLNMIGVLAWNKHFFSDISLGQVLVPYNNDYSFLEYILSGKPKDENRDQIMQRINTILKRNNLTDKKWSDIFSGGHDTANLTSRMRQGAIFSRNKEMGIYLNPRAGYKCWEESEMYDDEWMGSGYRNPTDNHYHRHPVKSYADMLLYKTREFLRRFPQCKGLYYDNLYPSRKMSLFHGAREISLGNNSFTGDIFSLRELVKRSLILAQMEKRFLSTDPNYAWLVAHMTDANIVPVIGLTSISLGWEMKFGRQDFQDRFPEEFHHVQSLGTQTGTIPISIISTSGSKQERAHQHRTLYAVAFAFDMLNFWDPGSREEDNSKIFNQMQILVRSFGYGTNKVKHYPGYDVKNNIVNSSAKDVKITVLKRNDNKIMLLVGNLGKTSNVKLTYKGIKVTNLKNAENNKTINNNQFTIPKHDCLVLVGDYQNL